jgi:hypothetical protein
MAKLRKLEELVKDTYGIHEASRNLTGFAILSLRVAVEAFCSTYHAMRGRLHVLKEVDVKGPRDDLHATRYHEAFAECVIHFQHFAELVIKDFLRAEHPLLADDTSSHHVLFHKLLKGEAATTDEDGKLKSVEFSEASDRLYKLIKADRIDQRVHFVAAHAQTLAHLTSLRNRLLHRGTVVMRYRAADEFFGGYILPFVLEVAELDEYKKLDAFWRPRPIDCKVDVLAEISACCKDENYNLEKVAVLKELGRSAFANPIAPDVFSEMLDPPYRRYAEKLVADYKEHGGEAHRCPACGIEAALISYDSEEDINEDGSRCIRSTFPYSVRCLNCSFEINNELSDENMFGLPIRNFFK